MSSYSALFDVGRTLSNLIWTNTSSDPAFRSIISSENQIVLLSPDKLASSQKLCLFLYHIEEDAYKKNTVSGTTDLDHVGGQPIPLKLYYMIVPNTNDGEKDLLLLGKVVEIFNSNRILRDPYLKGSQAGGFLKLVFHTPAINDINLIWSVVSRNKPYVTSVYYEVLPIIINSIKSEEIVRVKEVEYSYTSEVS